MIKLVVVYSVELEIIPEFDHVEYCGIEVERFPDSELKLRFSKNLNGMPVLVISPATGNSNDDILALMLMIDVVRRSGAASISVFIPYLWYARQDRIILSEGNLTPLSAKVVANSLLSCDCISKIFCLDMHSRQLAGFFSVPVMNLDMNDFFVNAMLHDDGIDMSRLTIVAPDAGSLYRVKNFSESLCARNPKVNTKLAVMSKNRPIDSMSEVWGIVGDVDGRFCIIVDDIVDSAGTLCNAVEFLISCGAIDVVAFITHGLLSGDALSKISSSLLKRIYISNSISRPDINVDSGKFVLVSISGLVHQVIGSVISSGCVL